MKRSLSPALPAGPDPLFPYLDEGERFPFPAPETWKGDMVAVGGNLSPGMLLSAYEQGLFPWYNPGDPVIWQSPDPRFVIFPEKLHISASMKKILCQGVFEIALDRDFPALIAGCAGAERPRRGPDDPGGTWISADIIAAYTTLHRLGWVHGAGAYREGELLGGCYGIRLGNAFFGESMFAKTANASKAAFLTLARRLFDDGVRFIDCQIPSEHLRSLGGEELSRRDFLALLGQIMAARGASPRERDRADRRGNWGAEAGSYEGIMRSGLPPQG